jgi:hypothetical protein
MTYEPNKVKRQGEVADESSRSDYAQNDREPRAGWIRLEDEAEIVLQILIAAPTAKLWKLG